MINDKSVYDWKEYLKTQYKNLLKTAIKALFNKISRSINCILRFKYR